MRMDLEGSKGRSVHAFLNFKMKKKAPQFENVQSGCYAYHNGGQSLHCSQKQNMEAGEDLGKD